MPSPLVVFAECLYHETVVLYCSYIEVIRLSRRAGMYKVMIVPLRILSAFRFHFYFVRVYTPVLKLASYCTLPSGVTLSYSGVLSPIGGLGRMSDLFDLLNSTFPVIHFLLPTTAWRSSCALCEDWHVCTCNVSLLVPLYHVTMFGRPFVGLRSNLFQVLPWLRST